MVDSPEKYDNVIIKDNNINITNGNLRVLNDIDRADLIERK